MSRYAMITSCQPVIKYKTDELKNYLCAVLGDTYCLVVQAGDHTERSEKVQLYDGKCSVV